MYVDISNPFWLLVILFVNICLIYVGWKEKKAIVTLIPLLAFLALLVSHFLQITAFAEQYENVRNNIISSMTWDFSFILLSYTSYLWVDEVETKFRNKKSIDNSLSWFWNKV